MTRLMIERGALSERERGPPFPIVSACIYVCRPSRESIFYIFLLDTTARYTRAAPTPQEEIHARGEPNERPTHVRDCAHTLHAQHHHKCTERHIVQNGYTRGYPLSLTEKKRNGPPGIAAAVPALDFSSA